MHPIRILFLDRRDFMCAVTVKKKHRKMSANIPTIAHYTHIRIHNMHQTDLFGDLLSCRRERWEWIKRNREINYIYIEKSTVILISSRIYLDVFRCMCPYIYCFCIERVNSVALYLVLNWEKAFGAYFRSDGFISFRQTTPTKHCRPRSLWLCKYVQCAFT